MQQVRRPMQLQCHSELWHCSDSHDVHNTLFLYGGRGVSPCDVLFTNQASLVARTKVFAGLEDPSLKRILPINLLQPLPHARAGPGPTPG